MHKADRLGHRSVRRPQSLLSRQEAFFRHIFISISSSMATALVLLNSLMIGGSERKIVRIANALRRAGDDIHLAYLNNPCTLLGDLDPDLPAVHLSRSGKFSLPALGRLRRYVLEQRISHVACVNLYPLLYAQAVAWQLGKRAPVISALINTTDFLTRKDERQMMLYAPLLRRAGLLVFGCRLQQELWSGRYGLPMANSRVIYNGVDQAHFNPAAVAETREELRRRYGFPQEAFIAVTVGQLRREKQQTDLIRAVATLVTRGRPIHALLVGEGVERSAIERCISDLGVRDRVHLVGPVDDVRPLLKIADAFVLTSTAVETFSNATLEAMAMGMPIILSRIGGAAEMVQAGNNGFLYSPGSVAELAEHIAAFAGDDALTKKVGAAAAARVQDSFGFTRMLDEYRSLLFASGSRCISGPGVHPATSRIEEAPLPGNACGASDPSAARTSSGAAI
jgi:glycosyltransferase involved in cell wall biosynthesis